jgi:galactitol-specific phosphotransferase system IIB component
MLESIVADGATRTSDPTLNKVLAAHGHGQVTEAILQQRLRTYIEEADMEQAMAGAQFDEANVVREEVYIPMLTTARKFEREMHSNVAVLKLATTKTV